VSRSDSRRKKEPVADRWVPGVNEEKGGEGARLLSGLGRGLLGRREEEAQGGGKQAGQGGSGPRPAGHQAEGRAGRGYVLFFSFLFVSSPFFQNIF